MSSPSNSTRYKSSRSALRSGSKPPPMRPSRPSSPALTLTDVMYLFNPGSISSKEELAGYEFYTKFEARQFGAKTRPMSRIYHAHSRDKVPSSSEDQTGFFWTRLVTWHKLGVNSPVDLDDPNSVSSLTESGGGECLLQLLVTSLDGQCEDERRVRWADEEGEACVSFSLLHKENWKINQKE